MMKLSFKIFILVLILNIDLLAKNSRLSLELSRANQIDRVVKRVNSISDFINLFIMETGRIPNNINELRLQYPHMIISNGYNGTITFTISNNIISFVGVATNLSVLSNQLYRNNANLHPMAEILPNLNMNIPLDTKAIQFLGKVNAIESLDTANTVFIGSVEPTDPITLNPLWCNVQSTDEGNIWYRPDFSGSFIASFCDFSGPTHQWTPITNELNIAVVRNDKAALDLINPPRGTVGYSKENGGSTKWHEYVFDGSTWQEVQ